MTVASLTVTCFYTTLNIQLEINYKKAYKSMLKIVPAGTLAINFGCKILIYGRPGTGKTPLINTAPRPVLCVVEPGMLSMRGSQIAAIECYTPELIKEFFDWLKRSNEAKQFDTIGIDSISQMSEIILTYELKRNRDGRKAYGEMSRTMMEYINDLYFMRGKHIYLIAKELQVDNNGILYKKPYFPGNDLNVKVPHLFDEIFYISPITIPQQPQPVIGIRTKEAYDCIARDRSGKLNEIEPPDLNYLINKCLN